MIERAFIVGAAMAGAALVVATFIGSVVVVLVVAGVAGVGMSATLRAFDEASGVVLEHETAPGSVGEPGAGAVWDDAATGRRAAA